MKFLYILICLFFFSFNAFASECTETFTWLPNTEEDLAGYRIYYGNTNFGPYPNVVSIDPNNIVDGRVYGTVSGLECGHIYYFICRAYNANNTESDNSVQVKVVTGNKKFPWVLFIPAITY